MTQPNDYAREVSSLRDQVAELQEEVAELRKVLAPNTPMPKEWKLDPAERRIVACLFSSPNGFRSKEALMMVAASTEWRERCEQLLSVRIYKLRKKIEAAKIGIEINNVRSEGYAMPKASREIVARAIAEAA